MFDELHCDYPLPIAGANAVRYQTKDTPAQWMELYCLRADGTLWVHAHDTEDHSDPTQEGFARLAGILSSVNFRWEPCTAFTGEVVFYGTLPTGEWLEFLAYLVRGTLKHLETLRPRPPEDAA